MFHKTRLLFSKIDSFQSQPSKEKRVDMGVIQVLTVVSLFVAAATAQEENSSDNFVHSRAKRSPQYTFGQSSPSSIGVGGGYYNPYYDADYGYNRPLYYRSAPVSDLSYNFNLNRPPYSNHGLMYPASSFHQGGYSSQNHQPQVSYHQHENAPGYHYDSSLNNNYNINGFLNNGQQHQNHYTPRYNPLNWHITPRTFVQDHQQIQVPGVLVWVPLDTLRQHIQLEEELDQHKQYEQELELKLMQLQQQRALLEEEEEEYAHHAPLDNQDAMINSGVPHYLPNIFYPLHEDLHPNSVYHYMNNGISPNREIMDYSHLLEPQMMHQPIWGQDLEYVSPYILPETLGTPEALATALAQGNIPQPTIPLSKSQKIVKKSVIKPTQTTTTKRTTTTSTTTRPPTILREANDVKVSTTTTLNPTVLQENKNEVDFLESNPK